MKLLPIVLAFAAVGASAQTYYTGQADQERRDRNREEALANYRAGHMNASTTEYTAPHRHTVRGETHKAANATREAGHEVAALCVSPRTVCRCGAVYAVVAAFMWPAR